MKTTNYLTLAAAALLTLAGCTQDNEPTASGLPMTGAPMRPVVEVSKPVTRESMTSDDLDHYYFRVTDQDDGTDEYNYFTTMTLKDGQWTGDKEMTWQSTFPKVSALEQKGVNWSETDYTDGKDVFVETDQSTRDGLLKSDLLYMAPKTISAADLDDEKNIKVNLAHLFAKLKVVVTVNGVPYNPIKSLVIGGTKIQAHFTPETGELGAVSGYATAITAYIEDEETSPYTYECILLPQTVEANTLTVTAYFDETQSQEKTYTHASALTLQGNTQYTLSLSMDHEGKFTPSSSVGVGGWDNEDIEGGELEERAEITYDPSSNKFTYTVSTARGLLEWAKAVQDDESPNLTLTEDIDMKGKTWPAIERCNGVTIDGGGHTIKNLTLTEKARGCVGLIIDCNKCTIRNLTLLNPSIDLSEAYGGFFIGGMANGCTIENCHVIGGTTNDEYTKSNLVYYANGCRFIASSVTSSSADMISIVESYLDSNLITACYVTGGKLVVDEGSAPTYNASYYQESADGSITAAGNSSAVTSWGEAATQMNTALSETSYQWVENPDKEDTERPLVIETQTTD